MTGGKKKELSAEERWEIIGYHKVKHSIRQISKLTGFKCSTVFDTIARFKKTNSVSSLPRSGRPPALSPSDSRYLRLCSIRDRRKCVPILTEEFNAGRQFPVSNTVCRRSLLSWSLHGRVAARKPLLSLRNVKKRLAFARKHVKWSKSKWAKVLFTDESKFELFGSKRRVFVRRMPGERFIKECLTPTVKHGGGSIMVWGGISTSGVTRLKRIVGIMDQKVYHNILVRTALPEGKRLIGKGFVFQEDNDPKHASKFCRNYLEKKEKSGIILGIVRSLHLLLLWFNFCYK